MPKIDRVAITPRIGSSYPAPYDEACRARSTESLATAAGLTQFGVNIVTLEPGAWSSQRHWHSHEDEFVMVLSGELTLIENEGEQLLRPGDTAAWPAGVANGHHLVNRSSLPARLLAVGSRHELDEGHYPDIDLHCDAGRYERGPSECFRKK